MRSIQDTKIRWEQLFSNKSIGVDLRQAVVDGGPLNPCEDGLRSICWKAFLLYGPLSQSSWPKKLLESRSAYSSLKDHFLKYIDNPNDLQSNVDPLDDDDTSPWSNLRKDELNREEILQDVQRCMQENFFFREPSVQKKLLDILFIYSKLNPDIGYRQGMHELLAPIFWVVDCDATNNAIPNGREDDEDKSQQLMYIALDSDCIEHDAFSLFCAVMQTAKVFYEPGNGKGSSPIISRSHKIQEDLLSLVDPELAHHLQAIGVLPQVYLIRWIRLLFEREFEFTDILKIWDILFAESISLATLDMCCLVMLLHIRWPLVDADYTTALGLLLKYKFPQDAGKPPDIVKSARYLQQNLSVDGGATLIKQFSGRAPRFVTYLPRPPQTPPPRPARIATPVSRARAAEHRRERSSPGISPARFLPQQKNLEALFQEVSGGIQRRTEGWNLSKAVLGAVGEVKRNVNNFQASPGPQRAQSDMLSARAETTDIAPTEIEGLKTRVEELESRNKVLARMLDSALQSLRSSQATSAKGEQHSEDTFNISLAKIQFVSVYLADAEIPIPGENLSEPAAQEKPTEPTKNKTEADVALKQEEDQNPVSSKYEKIPEIVEPEKASTATGDPVARKANVRPSLAESSFSFMLGENRHRSSFVSSVSDLPEQRRDSESRPRPKNIRPETAEIKEKKAMETDDDGFTMNPLRGNPNWGGDTPDS